MYTEIVRTNVLSRSRNTQVYSNPSHNLWFATKSSPGLQRVEAHRNSCQKRTQPVEKPQVQPKPRNRLWFRTKSSLGDQRVEAHRISPQKRIQQVEKPPGIFITELQTTIQGAIVSWASAYRGTPKQSPKTYSAGWENPRYSQNRATYYELRQNIVLGINVWRHTEIVPKKVLSGSNNPQVGSKPSNGDGAFKDIVPGTAI